MKKCIATCLYLVFFVGTFAIQKEKIVGGVNAEINEFPYQASIRYNGMHFCGGSIIGKWHILTAAHCVSNFVWKPFNINVYTGSNKSVGTSGNKNHVKRIYVHPGYLGTDSSSYRHDIAILMLTDEIAFNANQTAITIPTQDIRLGDNATITGWGVTKFPSKRPAVILQKANMKIIPSTDCIKYMPAEMHNKLVLYEEQVCALNKKGIGACQGDSGGALTVNNQVVGIASFVVPCGESYPDVYTKVYAYVDWIEAIKNINN